MIIKHDFKLSSFLFFVFFFLMGCITVLLSIEYQSFREQYAQLIQVKKKYQQYVCAYRKMILEYQGIDDECGIPEYQTMNNQSLFVNRDPAYLKKSAAQYGGARFDQELLGSLYSDPWTLYSEGNSSGVLRKKTNSAQQKKSTLVQRKPALNVNAGKRGMFAWPIEKSLFWLSSKFGPRKKKDGSWGYHHGIDMAAIKGTPVKAPAAGTVVEAAHSQKGYGKTVVIKHTDGIHHTRYAHLNTIAVNVGQKVATGQRLGAVGNTGFVRGKNGGENAHHLHFEVKQHGKHVNPLSMLK